MDFREWKDLPNQTRNQLSGWETSIQGLVEGAILCFRNLNFYFRHGESTSTANSLLQPAKKVRI